MPWEGCKNEGFCIIPFPRIAKSHITVMSLFSSCHSLSWVCSVLQAALNIFVHVLLYMCRCLFLQCRTRTTWAHFKTHCSSPWASGSCVTGTTGWHNKMWENGSLQIRCTGVNLSSQFCWHRRTWEENWASQHRHQQNSEDMWRIALGLTSLSSHFMHWNAFQNYLAHLLHHKTYACFPVRSKRDPKPWA